MPPQGSPNTELLPLMVQLFFPLQLWVRVTWAKIALICLGAYGVRYAFLVQYSTHIMCGSLFWSLALSILFSLTLHKFQLTYSPVPIANCLLKSWFISLIFNKERATVPFSNYCSGVWAVDIFNLRSRHHVRACGLVAASIVSTVDKYNQPRIWQKEEENLTMQRIEK